MFFYKKRFPDGRREVYFLGKKICGYRKAGAVAECPIPYADQFSNAGYQAARENGLYRVEGRGLRLEMESAGSLYAAKTVLCCEEYSFDIGRPFVMIDIGLNLGFTSLWTLRNAPCVKSYGFEPFLPTFRLAERNLSLNPPLADRLEIFPFGLGKERHTVEISYNPDFPGSMSTVTDRFLDRPEFHCERVQIENASEILAPILDRHEEAVFLKMDCEGGEREILPDLAESRLLDRIDVLVMEWHEKVSRPWVDLLRDHRFHLFCTTNEYAETGIIRAVKNRPS